MNELERNSGAAQYLVGICVIGTCMRNNRHAIGDLALTAVVVRYDNVHSKLL